MIQLIERLRSRPVLAEFTEEIGRRHGEFELRAWDRRFREVDQEANRVAGGIFARLVHLVNKTKLPILLYSQDSNRHSDIMGKRNSGATLLTKELGKKMAHDSFLSMIGVPEELMANWFSKEETRRYKLDGFGGVNSITYPDGAGLDHEEAVFPTRVDNYSVEAYYRVYENFPYHILLLSK